MTAPRPNVLWITTDQQRYDTIGALGNPEINTPNLDRLCREGVAFTQAYCQSPICTPSRASFMTGLYPSRLPCNINGNLRMTLPDDVKLISRHLADAGYDCGLSGKLHLASCWAGVENRVDDGYRYFACSHAPMQGMGMGNQYTDWLESLGRLDEVLDLSNFNPQLQRGARYREDVPFDLHQTTWCCDRAIEFMNQERSGPWLMSVNIFDPHPAYDAPASYDARYDAAALSPPPFLESDLTVQERIGQTHVFQGAPHVPGDREQECKANYYAMIELIDENVGCLMDALEQNGQRQDTLVIFTSDHGNLLGDHGLCQKGCRFYEGLVRVPLIMSWPGRFRDDARFDGLVELTDIAPTLAELAGIELPRTDGRSLAPILTGAAASDQHRNFVRCEFYDVLDMHFNVPNRPPHRPSYATMLREGPDKLVVYHGSDYGELYDLAADPDEHHNLWDNADKQALKARLIRKSNNIAPVTRDRMERVGRF